MQIVSYIFPHPSLAILYFVGFLGILQAMTYGTKRSLTLGVFGFVVASGFSIIYFFVDKQWVSSYFKWPYLYFLAIFLLVVYCIANLVASCLWDVLFIRIKQSKVLFYCCLSGLLFCLFSAILLMFQP